MEPEKGRFYRSDHFELGKVGVPALYPKTGNEFVGKPADFGPKMREMYDATDYHKPSDEVGSITMPFYANAVRTILMAVDELDRMALAR